MSDWVRDINHMHVHYGFHEKVEALGQAELKKLLEFRYKFLEEEMREMFLAIDSNDSEGVVDALIDLCVVAIGTLDLYKVDVREAWDRVHAANMSKKVGVKASRPNPLGLPDLIKPEGWVGPDHTGNHGKFTSALEDTSDGEIESRYTEVNVD